MKEVKHDQSLFVFNLLNHSDSVTEYCHKVTLFQGALALAANVVLLACFD